MLKENDTNKPWPGLNLESLHAMQQEASVFLGACLSPHQLCERVGTVMLLMRKSGARAQVMLLLPTLIRAGTRRGAFLDGQLATAQTHPVIKTDESTH